MSIKDLITRKLFKLPIKDPDDFLLTKSSTPWVGPKCKSATTIQERARDCCYSCGRFLNINGYRRSRREIWNGEKWVTQLNYSTSNDTKYEILDK